MEIGTFSSDCFSDFTDCKNGYSINFWIKFSQHTALEQDIEVLEFGEFQLINFYNVSNSKAYLKFKDDECKLSFDLPIEAWAHISINVNATINGNGLTLFLNGVEFTAPENCILPTDVSSDFKISVGGVDKICLDEFSVVPTNNKTDIPEFYNKMTKGKY